MENRFEKLNEILEREDVKEKLANAKNEKDMYNVIVEAGMEISYEEFEGVLIALGEALSKQNSDLGELGEDDLENVAGGAIGEILAAIGLTTPIGTGVLVVAGVVCLGAMGIGAYNKYKKMKRG